MVYHSRRDKATAIFYFVILLLGFFLLIYSVLNIISGQGELFISIFNAIIGMVVSFLILITYTNTYYTLKAKTLFIRSGPFTDDIRYQQIEKIEKVRGLVIGAALARDRLRLYCGKKKNGRPNIVHISPQRPDEFLKKLLKNAPHIDVTDKRKNPKEG